MFGSVQKKGSGQGGRPGPKKERELPFLNPAEMLGQSARRVSESSRQAIDETITYDLRPAFAIQPCSGIDGHISIHSPNLRRIDVSELEQL